MILKIKIKNLNCYHNNWMNPIILSISLAKLHSASHIKNMLKHYFEN
jgi:hypothetical protein